MEQNSIRKEKNIFLSKQSGETLSAYIDRLHAQLQYAEGICNVHFTWYTHKNAAGCWICDTIVALANAVRVLAIIEEQERDMAHNEQKELRQF